MFPKDSDESDRRIWHCTASNRGSSSLGVVRFRDWDEVSSNVSCRVAPFSPSGLDLRSSRPR